MNGTKKIKVRGAKSDAKKEPSSIKEDKSDSSIKGKSKRKKLKISKPLHQKDMFGEWRTGTLAKVYGIDRVDSQIKVIDTLLEEYRKLGNPKLDYTEAQKKKLKEIDQALDKSLSKPSDAIKKIGDEVNKLKASVRQKLESADSGITKLDVDTVLNWDKDQVPDAMTAGTKDTLDEQNDANALIWYHTLFGEGKDPTALGFDPVQEAILKQQQEFLKRYFFSLASLSILGGDQDTNEYQPLENFTTEEGERIGLATVASGGGLFNFRSQDGSGEEFRDFLYGLQSTKGFDSHKAGIKSVSGVPFTSNSLVSTDYVGAFSRPATHGNEFTKEGEIKELSKGLLGSETWTGINIPLGGIGQHLPTAKGTEAVTDYQGRSQDNRGNVYQTGTVLFKHYQDGKFGNTLIGMEGSSPHTENIHGETHKELDTFKKKVLGGSSKKTLTGQAKRDEWGVASGTLEMSKYGGRIATVDTDSLSELERQWADFNKKMSPEEQKTFFKKLLLTTTQKQRDDLFKGYGLSLQKRAAISKDFSPQKRTSIADGSSPTRSSLSLSDDAADIPPPPPVLDLATGTILEEAKGVFRDAYREDVRKGAFLTEAEGQIIANEMNIKVKVYDQLPDGYVRESNPGGGDCLLYSLLQAKAYQEKQPLPSDADMSRTIDQEKYRDIIAAQLTDEQIDNLVTAALKAEINGTPEPGLGSNVVGLLQHSDVGEYRDKKRKDISPKSPDSQDKSKGGKAVPEPVIPAFVQPIATYGDGQGPLLEGIALLHSNGNHYEMIRLR
jgi:hypothetical protein